MIEAIYMESLYELFTSYQPMKIKLIIIVAIVVAMVSCMDKKASPSSESDDSLIVALKDSIKSEMYKTEDSEEEVLQTQTDINIAAGKGYDEYKESIEEQYQLLITALPQYKNEFNKEKKSMGEVSRRCSRSRRLRRLRQFNANVCHRCASSGYNTKKCFFRQSTTLCSI